MIQYVDSAERVTAVQLRGFFAGWPQPPDADTHLRLLESSDHVVLAVDSGSRDVVGFITAISDGILSAYIPFLEVRTDCRGRGIGRELVRRMLTTLDGLYMIDLLCDRAVQPFYRSLGMKDATGMMRRDYARQSGRTP